MDFKFGVTVPLSDGAVESAALGVNAAGKFTDYDKNKLVKLAANNNYVLVADGDDIDGIVISIEPHTVNNGFGFGSVQIKDDFEATVTGGALTVGAAVVAAAQSAVGTAQSYPKIKAGAGVLFLCRVKSLLNGTGQIGETVLVERITRK